MEYTNEIPAAAYGVCRKTMIQPRHLGGEFIHSNDPAAYLLNPETGRYEQGGDRNQCLHVTGITQCAGRWKGLYNMPDSKRIVIDSPLKPITPAKGEFILINALLDSFTACELDEDSREQKRHLLAWIRSAAESFYKNEPTAAPVLILRAQNPNQTDAASLIVKHIIAPLLGDGIEDLKPYLTDDKAKITAQGQTAALLYAEDLQTPSADTRRDNYIKTAIFSTTKSINAQEEIINNYMASAFCFKPLLRTVIFTRDSAPYIDLTQPEDKSKIMMLYINKPTLNSKDSTLNELAKQCRQELPAFLYYLLNEHPEDLDACGYISSPCIRLKQKADFLRAISGALQPAAYCKLAKTVYKLATLFIMEHASKDTATLYYTRPNTMEVFKHVTACANALNMPLPAKDWTAKNLEIALNHCARYYSAYIFQDAAGGWNLNLPAIERDLMP